MGQVNQLLGQLGNLTLTSVVFEFMFLIALTKGLAI